MTSQLEEGGFDKLPRPAPFIVEPETSHSHTFILLHGLGDQATTFGRGLLHIGLTSENKSLAHVFPGAKFIFPNAKFGRCTALRRSKVRMWCNYYSFEDRYAREDVQTEGIIDTAAYIRSLIEQEMKIVPAKNIILGGISNGCATSLVALLGLEFPIGAYVGLCARLPFARDMNAILRNGKEPADDVFSRDEDDKAAQLDPTTQVFNFVRELLTLETLKEHSDMARNSLATPVFLGHGDQDQTVPLSFGEEAQSMLLDLGMSVTWKRYPKLGHWYQVPEEIDDIVVFLREKLGNGASDT